MGAGLVKYALTPNGATGWLQGILLDKQEALAKVIATRTEFIATCVVHLAPVMMDTAVSSAIVTQLTRYLTRHS